MKNNPMSVVILGLVLLLTAPASWAATIEFNPIDQKVLVGDSVFVDIIISGLGDGSAPSLGVFDLDIGYDTSLLGFNSAIFGDTGLGDQLDFSGYGADYEAATFQGGLHLYGLSYDTPDTLDTLQADTFTLARLEFQSLDIGTSDLDLELTVLGDAYGNALAADTQSGTIHATPVPSALLLLSTGLAGAWAGISRKKRVKR